MLTEYDNLFCDDFFIPTGDLRDDRKSAGRADIIIVTKCPANLSLEEKEEITEKIDPALHQSLFFTTIAYGTPYHIYNPSDLWVLTMRDEVLLVCGIANPLPLKNYLHENTNTYYQLSYNDHHIFSIEDLQEIKEKLDDIQSKSKLILTKKMNYNMKHIIKIFLATIIVFSFNSCEDSDQVIDQVVADTEAGAM